MHLRCAIKKLAKTYGLGQKNDQTFLYNVSFFNYSDSRATKLIMGDGGTSNIAKLIENYNEIINNNNKVFNIVHSTDPKIHKILDQPVIIVCDNDDGLYNVNEKNKKKPNKLLKAVQASVQSKAEKQYGVAEKDSQAKNNYIEALKGEEKELKERLKEVTLLDADRQNFAKQKKSLKSKISLLQGDVDLNNPNKFYHITNNLYVVIMEKGKDQNGKRTVDRAVEDLYPAQYLETLINCRKFDRSNKSHSKKATTSGKLEFAKEVIAKNLSNMTTADFKEFESLLQSFTDIIEDYKTNNQQYNQL